MEQYFRKILEAIGEDPERQGLKKTPERAAKAFEFLTQGYRQSVEEVTNNAFFDVKSDELVLIKNIEFYSLCEHHLLPFFGKCHVGYLSKGKVIGVSKVARIVDLFAYRLQVQEHLTQQIAETLMEVTGATGVGVVMEAQHLCMMMRGVEKQHSLMKTSAMLGQFREDASTRSEFFSLIS